MSHTQAILSFLSAAGALGLLIYWMGAPYKHESSGIRPPMPLLWGALVALLGLALMITE